MVGVMVRGENPPASFDILPDEHLIDQRFPPLAAEPSTIHGSGALEELPVDYQAQRPKRLHALDKPQDADYLQGTHPLAKAPSRGPRRRPPIGIETFEPLEKPQEEAPTCLQKNDVPSLAAEHFTSPQAPASGSPSSHHVGSTPLASARVDHSIEHIVEKQLAGQYEWVITYPAPARSPEHHRPRISRDGKIDGSRGMVTYGCNLLARNPRSTSPQRPNVGENANSYTFIATPLTRGDEAVMSPSEEAQDLEHQVNMTLSQQMATVESPLKAPEVVEVVEHAVSPSLTQVSERSGSFMDQSSRGHSFSVPRIEDSLEELDKLEEEIEAVKAVANSRHVEHKKTGPNGGTPPSSSKPATAKRVTIAAGQSATVRVKPSEKTRPALRRSNSLTFREKRTGADELVPEQKAANVPIARSMSTNTRSTDSRTPVKSTKPLTVPKFQLPGEAVSQRLKEQREARKAQQAEAQKASAAPPRSRSSKPLTKPIFELPGEAISRRKREEREARLKAQEEQERRRREFKARPFRHSMTPGTVPRETIASRARQDKVGPEETPRSHDANRTKRLAASNSLSRRTSATPGAHNSPQSRGRNSVVLPSDDGSRATSVSTNVSEKRSSVSLEEVAQQRARGKAIFARDNSYYRNREHERRERESAAKLAREQAAERSRAASREWAERQRQKQQGHMETMRSKGQGRL